jgi:hypothetical protein
MQSQLNWLSLLLYQFQLQWRSQKKRTCKQGVWGTAAPLKLKMFSCRGWQKFMSGNCNCEYVVHFSNQKYFKNKKTNKQTKPTK